MFVGSKPASVTNTASVMSYTFKLPEDLPSSDKAVFAWTWANASGNREFYMNCADIAIKGGKSKSYTGKKMTVVNYPGYPAMAEFNGNYDTGIELYNNAPKVTISPGGSSSAPSDSGNDKPPKGDSKPPKDEPIPHAPKSSAPAAPAPTGSSGSGSCTHGAMACDSGNSGYKVCVYGNWNPPIPCPAGTKCKSSGGSAICDWA
ncbi:hypothetical protein DL89DRAFT_265874 [Linderina pennispora]|uniref:Chitin-binding type-4 domain-containing protein n=1 Tax=Linderina pennispora TaxID=61395 RepID=A0A1Y1WFD3_9FUNG|nr:uncharacterized protein DL89DRAFT_265874 [Linderina pennispora]ORX72271.1 hypothetical protein DL89DRAFT_265874 [Linderina pennispora]